MAADLRLPGYALRPAKDLFAEIDRVNAIVSERLRVDLGETCWFKVTNYLLDRQFGAPQNGFRIVGEIQCLQYGSDPKLERNSFIRYVNRVVRPATGDDFKTYYAPPPPGGVSVHN